MILGECPPDEYQPFNLCLTYLYLLFLEKPKTTR